MIKLAQSSIGFDPKRNQDADPSDHPIDLLDIIPLAAAAGYEGLEIWAPHIEGFDAARLQEIKAAAAAVNLQLPMISPYFNFTKNLDKARDSMAIGHRVIEQAKVLGVSHIRTFTGGDRSRDASQEQWDRCRDCLQELCDAGKDHGIGLCLHTHDWNLVDTIAGCQRILELVDRDNCTLLYKPAYFVPHQQWTLNALGPQTAVVQVTCTNKATDLAEGYIDYRAQMDYFHQRQQEVWFSFTWMGENASGVCKNAAPYLQACRSAVSR